MASAKSLVESAILRAAMAAPAPVQRLLAGRAVVIDGQTLAPELQLMLRLQALAKQPCLGEPPIEKARAIVEVQAAMAAGRHPIGVVRELTVDGGDGPLGARLYVPAARLGPDPAPTLLFVHGGGHATGSLETHEAVCRVIAERAAVQVLSIDYRLAPDHPFPAAADDCFAAYQWLVKHADAVNADPERLAVGGDSAGGNLAAATAIQVAEAGLPMAFQLLLYPVTDFVNRSRSRELFDGGGFYLSRKGMERLRGWYLADGTDPAHPLVSLALRTELPAGLAPALLVTAGFDPLRDEGERYAQLMTEQGVKVEVVRHPSMIHAFANVMLGRESRAALEAAADTLRAALA